ncbi:SFT2 domain protein [Kalaharituber pfeilii]|nr:SFT2 domain protein [Kalaharituber pfeilii]
MTTPSFRSQMNSLGWSRRADAAPAPAPSSASPFLAKISSWNPFSSGGYIRLPGGSGSASEGLPPPVQAQQGGDEGFFGLSRFDRLLAFAVCNLGALACFVLCFMLFPMLSLKPRKFAVLWSFGSLLFLASWAILQGPMTYARHLFSQQRLPFTAAYFGAIGGTLWFSIGLKSTFLTLLAVVVQIVALMWYLVSYFPMGSQGLRFASQMGVRRAASWVQG